MKLMPEGSTDYYHFINTRVPKLTIINKFPTCASTNLLLIFALLPGFYYLTGSNEEEELMTLMLDQISLDSLFYSVISPVAGKRRR